MLIWGPDPTPIDNQRQHQALDRYPFHLNRREECIQMSGEIARSTPRPPFELPEGLAAVQTSLQSCRNPRKREYSRQFGSREMPGNGAESFT